MLSPAIVMLDAGAKMVDAQAKLPFVRNKGPTLACFKTFLKALGEMCQRRLLLNFCF